MNRLLQHLINKTIKNKRKYSGNLMNLSEKKIGKLINGRQSIKFLNLNIKKKTQPKQEKNSKLINTIKAIFNTNIKINYYCKRTNFNKKVLKNTCKKLAKSKLRLCAIKYKLRKTFKKKLLKSIL